VTKASDLVEVGLRVDAGQGLEHHRQQSMESGRRQPIGAASLSSLQSVIPIPPRRIDKNSRLRTSCIAALSDGGRKLLLSVR
jgi:hypothetical protein